MKSNFDAESAKKIIYEDNVNVTETNPLKDLFEIALNIFLIIVSLYLLIFITSGIILKTLPLNQQIAIENFLSPVVSPHNIVNISEKEAQRLKNIKNNIIKADAKFPLTSNLDIKVIDKKQLNALCYPNGNIYITSALYNELKTDEEFTFNFSNYTLNNSIPDTRFLYDTPSDANTYDNFLFSE